MHAYNNILVRDHQKTFKETCWLLNFTQFSSPEASNVTKSMYVFSEIVYVRACVCVCVCVHKWQYVHKWYFHVILQCGHMILGSLCLIQECPVEMQ